jgi:hypothetical protein
MRRNLLDGLPVHLSAVEVHPGINSRRVETKGTVYQGKIFDGSFPIEINDEAKRFDQVICPVLWLHRSI